jgi:hypothetical protein
MGNNLAVRVRYGLGRGFCSSGTRSRLNVGVSVPTEQKTGISMVIFGFVVSLFIAEQFTVHIF